MGTQLGLTVGIDLGTSNTVVAILGEDGRPEVVKNSSGSATTPSVVFGDPPHFTVGEVALQSLAEDESKVVRFVKRAMGKARSFRLGGLACSPEFISSLILRKVVADTELC